MEARLAVVLAAVILIRLPFLNQAIQGDDVYYLAIARNVAVDPLHPMQMGYTFQGARVSMSGHPHPPLNAYTLALLLKIFGGVREWQFHLVYILFSLAAAAAMHRLARRFTERPLLATLLFVAVPAFVVNGTSLEADLPFLALWTAGFAFYFDGRHRLAALSLALAGMAAYQAIFSTPILAYHAWYGKRRSKTAWLAVLAAPAALVAWQLFQRFSGGEAPAGVLAGYIQTYGLLALVKKLHSALALVAHLGWIVFPLAVPLWAATPAAALLSLLLTGYHWWQRALLALSLAGGLAILCIWIATLWKRRASEDGFLAAWGLVFSAGAVAVFFAGSARYLLPLAPAVVFTLVRRARRWWLLGAAAAANLAIGLLLAAANFDHWDQYRRFAARVRPLAAERQLWSNAEWGLRYYLEQLGDEPLARDQPVYRASLIMESELAGRTPFSTGGGRLQELVQSEIQSRRPARLIGLGTRSGYSSSEFGALPFDPGGGLLDRLKASIVEPAEPRLSYLRMNDPAAAPQLLSGFYQIENNAWRWMAGQAAALLRVPEGATRFEMTFFIPDAAPARRITVALNEIAIADQSYAAPGRYTLSVPVSLPAGGTVQVVVSADKSFQTPPDQRRLGIIMLELGLR